MISPFRKTPLPAVTQPFSRNWSSELLFTNCDAALGHSSEDNTPVCASSFFIVGSNTQNNSVTPFGSNCDNAPAALIR